MILPVYRNAGLDHPEDVESLEMYWKILSTLIVSYWASSRAEKSEEGAKKLRAFALVLVRVISN
jgi:hypothetical protein